MRQVSKTLSGVLNAEIHIKFLIYFTEAYTVLENALAFLTRSEK